MAVATLAARCVWGGPLISRESLERSHSCLTVDAASLSVATVMADAKGRIITRETLALPMAPAARNAARLLDRPSEKVGRWDDCNRDTMVVFGILTQSANC